MGILYASLVSLLSLGAAPVPTTAAPAAAPVETAATKQDLQGTDPLEHLKRHSRITPTVEVYEAVSPSVVFIQIEGTRRVRSLLGNRARVQRSSGSGTGVVIHEEGYLVTNYHVVRDADPGRIQVSFVDDPVPYRAELLSYREHEDLALLRITGSMEPFAPTPNLPARQEGNLTRDRGRQKFPTVRMGTSADLMPGERVVAIGNPHGQTHTVSEGIISGLHRDVDVEGPGFSLNFSNLIQTDASINLGNSGGPLLNVHGELIGINTVMNTAAENIGYAIPVDRVRDVLTQQLFPSAQNAWLGYEVEVGGEDLRVSRVWPGSPADRAGICTGDLVLRIAGKEVTDEASLLNANLHVKPYRNTEVLIESPVSGRISKQLTPWDRVSGILYENIGLTTDEVRNGRQHFVVVDRIRAESPAAELGLKPGDWLYAAKFQVNRLGTRSLPIGHRDDLLRLVGALPSGSSVELEIFRDENEDKTFTTDERYRGQLQLP